MNQCPSCGGIIGRDCFNPVQCAQITASIYNGDEYQRGFNDGQQWAMQQLREFDVNKTTEHPIDEAALWDSLGKVDKNQILHDLVDFNMYRTDGKPITEEDFNAAKMPSPLVESDGWISVNDRLPEDNETVLVFNGNHITTGYVLNEYRFVGDIPRLENRIFKHSNGLDWAITHWQPLPPRPKTTV